MSSVQTANDSVGAGSDVLAPPSMDPAQVQLVLKYHELMKVYMDERIADPYNEESTTTRYLQQAIALLEETAPQAEDPAPLMDALLLAKGFAATVLLSTRRSSQIPTFLSWVHAAQDLQIQQLLQRKQNLANEPVSREFWPCLIGFVVLGEFANACELIEQATTNAESEKELGILYDLLKCYPINSSKYSVFMLWRQNALNWLNNLQQTSLAHTLQPLVDVALILSGDVKTITIHTESWIAALAALFIYGDPSPEALDAHYAAATAHHDINLIPTWEEGCKLLFEDKVVAALGSLQLLDIGTAVVVSEFCSERGLFQKYSAANGKAGGGVREELALNYISACLAEPELVEIGLELMVNLGSTRAKQLASNLLPQLVQNLPEAAESALDAAEQLGLPHLVTKLCRTAAQVNLDADRCAGQGNGGVRYIAALIFYYRAADYQNVKDVAWQLFETTLLAKSAVGDELTISVLQGHHNLIELELPMMIKDSLAPTAVLLALLTSLDQEDIDTLLDSLNGLLSFPDPPLKYYPLLVALASGVSGAVLTLKNTTMLMGALDLWDTSTDSVKHNTYELITAAGQNPVWESNLGSETDAGKLVWLLRRQLAKEVCF